MSSGTDLPIGVGEGCAVPERDLPTLAELLDSPEGALNLPRHEAVRLLARVGALAEVLRVTVAAGGTGGPGHDPSDDGMLTPQEAARIAGLTVEQFYRRRAFKPAILKVGHRTLRVSEKKLRRIMAGMVSAH